MSVALTGIEVVSAAGAGFDAFRRALEGGASLATPVSREGGHSRLAPHPVGGSAPLDALLVPPDATRAWIAPMKSRRMSGPSRFAVAAARSALVRAGLTDAEGPDARLADALDPTRVAVALGTAFGSTEVTHKILLQCLDPGPEAISPFLFTESVASAHAGQVALELGFRGSNVTVTQGEASGALAVAHGADLVESGRADVVVAGGVEEVSPLLHAILDRMGALARDAGDGERARPFDARRNGFTLAEGGVALVLESEEHARRRGAPILARLVARARAFDPSAVAGRFGTGADALAERLRAALDRAGVRSASIDSVSSSASGTIHGDALEAASLRALFAGAVPPVVTPKAFTGEFGSFGLASALHVALGGRVPVDDFRVDPELRFEVASEGAGPRVLAPFLASSGPAAWLVIEGGDDAA